MLFPGVGSSPTADDVRPNQIRRIVYAATIVLSVPLLLLITGCSMWLNGNHANDHDIHVIIAGAVACLLIPLLIMRVVKHAMAEGIPQDMLATTFAAAFELSVWYLGLGAFGLSAALSEYKTTFSALSITGSAVAMLVFGGTSLAARVAFAD